MEKPFSITISNRQKVPTIQVDVPENLPQSMNDLGFDHPHPILVILGGANNMNQTYMNQLQSLFVKVLAPVVEELGASVVDGGTDSGVMQMMGKARAEISGKFSLIGVTPVGKVALPGQTPPEEVTPLEANHSHFVLTPGDNWGDESPWLADVATVLSQELPSVAILINGGQVSKQDVFHNLRANRPILAVAGSGRLADTLVSALAGEVSDEGVRELVASGLVSSIDINDSLESLTELIKSYLCQQKP
ncbi:MAG: hypothetical protein F6K62_25225 [Sphaerospermopsis sp. SIO1G2]|nr:hypothetical protein [Sphaerospermopsis sp. SIO1G2]